MCVSKGVSREPRVLALACEYRLDFRCPPGSVFDPPLLRGDERGLKQRLVIEPRDVSFLSGKTSLAARRDGCMLRLWRRRQTGHDVKGSHKGWDALGDKLKQHTAATNRQIVTVCTRESLSLQQNEGCGRSKKRKSKSD